MKSDDDDDAQSIYKDYTRLIAQNKAQSYLTFDPV